MEELKHSGLGIAATVIGGASTVLIFMLFMVAGVMELSTPGGGDEESTASAWASRGSASVAATSCFRFWAPCFPA